MHSFRNKYVSGPLALLVALVVTTSIALASGGVAASSAPSAPAAPSARTVAHTAQGKLVSRITGETKSGPLGHRLVRAAEVHQARRQDRGPRPRPGRGPQGRRQHPHVRRGPHPAGQVHQRHPGHHQRPRPRRGPAPATCCKLVLGPLDLDLLGLQVHLDKVVLNIVAQSGAGKLLGNLLCAVAGLLDGGLNGLLGRITNLLNRILAQLGLGL